MQINPAKAQQFGTGITNLAQLSAKIKDIFYLDDLLCFPARYDDEDFHGFYGLIRPGTANYNMHKASRRVEIHGDKLGASQITLNDAGLNTLGIAINLQNATVLNGDMQVKALFRSAYFVGTDSYGFEWKKSTDSTWLAGAEFPYMNQNTENEPTVTVYADYKVGETWNIRAFVQNAEGRFTSNAINITATVKIFLLKGPNTWPSIAYSSGSNISLYADTRLIGEGTTLYKEAGMVNTANAGYYVNETEGKWYEVALDGTTRKVVDIGNIGQWPAGDPATPPTWQIFNTFIELGGTQNLTCNNTNVSDPPQYPVWLNTSDGLYYYQQSAGSYANGYYTRSIGGVAYVTRFINGSWVGQTWKCSEPEPIIL